MKTVDVIVVFSSEDLDIVHSCLKAVLRKTQPPFRLIIVDNGSADYVTDYIDGFDELSYCHVIRNEVICGYPPAANQGLRASTADYCVLLNGDTIVTPGWLEKMIECADSDPRIGIVGPLSNAASWQSVPERTNLDGSWSTNPPPPNWSPNDVAQVVDKVSQREFPQIPFINGFCFLIKRRVINTIGYFDDVAFADGYGEEDEYCLRAADSGFVMAVADHAYVYHAKTKAYGGARRAELCRKSKAVIEYKYGIKRIKSNIERIQTHEVLNKCRNRVAEAFQGKQGEVK